MQIVAVQIAFIDIYSATLIMISPDSIKNVSTRIHERISIDQHGGNVAHSVANRDIPKL